MNRKALFIVAASLTLLVLAAWVGAQEPVPPLPLDAQVSTGSSFTYQGQLKNGGDVFDGSCDFQFRLYDAVSGGSQVGAIQTSTGIGVQEGFFSTNLDFGGEAFDGSARWLGISVRCPTGSGEYITLNPRQALSATPYALSLKPGALVINNASNPDGDPMPTAITGRATASSGHTIAILGEAYSPDGSAVSGDNYSSNGGTGVWGWSGATTGPAAGVRGSANSPQGAGVWGYNSATAGEGKGVLGDSNSPDGSGVFGYNDDGGDGVLGIVDGPKANEGTGVVGLNLATSGEGKGVLGGSNSPDGAGVFGYNDDGGDGVVGISDHGGSGVHGASFASGDTYGVSGVNYATTGWGIGVYGLSHSDGPAVLAENQANGMGLWTRSAHGNPIEALGNNLSDVEFYVTNTGDVFADGAFQSPAADFAELLPAIPGLETGDVLVIGPDSKLTRSTEPYQTTVVGVY
ncbi:MAG TPA: hypothetical protein PLC06_11145, partial [Promineifilum sp.]|nr:hypothetical protein [Promineifilum sp.]